MWVGLKINPQLLSFIFSLVDGFTCKGANLKCGANSPAYPFCEGNDRPFSPTKDDDFQSTVERTPALLPSVHGFRGAQASLLSNILTSKGEGYEKESVFIRLDGSVGVQLDAVGLRWPGTAGADRPGGFLGFRGGASPKSK